MISKPQNRKGCFFKDGKVIINIGRLIIILGMIMYSIMFSGGRASDVSQSEFFRTLLIITIVFLGGGYSVVRIGMKYKKRYAKYARYIGIIKNSRYGSIDNICKLTSKTYDEVYKDLKYMIKRGILTDSYIDSENRKVVSPLLWKPKSTYSHIVIEGKTVGNNQQKVLKCPNCGGVNTIINNYGICEYCESKISAN